MKGSITTRVFDGALDRPAAGVAVVLERATPDGFFEAGRGVTGPDGALATLLRPDELRRGTWRLSYATDAYYEATGQRGLYPEIGITFSVDSVDGLYDLQLTLGPNGYSASRAE